MIFLKLPLSNPFQFYASFNLDNIILKNHVKTKFRFKIYGLKITYVLFLYTKILNFLC